VTANKLLDFEREYPRGAKAAVAPSEHTRAALNQLRDALRGPEFPEAVTHQERGDSPEALVRETAAIHALIDPLIDWTAAEWETRSFASWTSFRLPKPVVYDQLVATEKIDDVCAVGPEEHYRRRDGFKVTDNRYTERQITEQSNYSLSRHHAN